MACILHRSLREVLGEEDSRIAGKFKSANIGLIYNKYIWIWPGHSAKDFLNSDWKKKKKKKKEEFFEALVRAMGQHPDLDALLKEVHERRRSLAAHLDGKILRGRTAWRLVIGLGSEYPLETGFLWHRVLGVPYIPGSSLKGMVRAWSEPWRESNSQREGCGGWGALENRTRVLELFGDTDENGCGRLLIFDALPVKKPKLEVDIINPHYAPYYADPKTSPPGDWYSPTPIPFLAVAENVEYEFIVAPQQRRGSREDVDEGVRLLKEALEVIGVGGKTAVGYGRFVDILVQEAAMSPKAEGGKGSEIPQGGKRREGPTQREQPLEPSFKLDGDLLSKLNEFRALPLEACKAETMMFYHERFKNEVDPSRKKQMAEVLRLSWIYTGDWEGNNLSKKQKEKVKEVKTCLSL